MYNFHRFCVVLVAAAALAGCGALLPTRSVGVDADVEKNTEKPADYSALAYYQWVKAAPVEQLEWEQRRLQQLARPETTVIDRVQLALLLSASVVASPDTRATARELLSGLRTDREVRSEHKDYAIFATLWDTVLEQQQSLAATAESRHALEQQIGKLRNENAALQEQIDALTSIEQQLMKQERANGKE